MPIFFLFFFIILFSYDNNYHWHDFDYEYIMGCTCLMAIYSMLMGENGGGEKGREGIIKISLFGSLL